MSKTYRTPSKVAKRFYKTDVVRDGTFTHYASSCRNRGGCVYCESNRMHKNRKRFLKSVDTDS